MEIPEPLLEAQTAEPKLLTRYFLRLSYNGTEFSGWQFQKNAISIQQTMNEKISMLLHEHIELTGCGRTDSGVHARKFYAHFMSEKDDLENNEKVLFRMNKILPQGIAIQQIKKMPEKAHARFHAWSRTYEYHICRIKDPFGPFLHWSMHDELNVEAMNEAAKVLMKYDDFVAFSKTSDVKTTICKLTKAEWRVKLGEEGTAEEGKPIGYVFEITANRFLRNMVRAIVGTLIDVGRGKQNLDDVHRIVQSKQRSQAGTSVPANGLFLTDVKYPVEYNL
ncbi:MAG: tRNA pseudouridine(38-40) synthase TruA [Bacteroidota bacterium]|nr:tRNA pseudouridine(38-40) synthase TruA [Bacteroidota bacterium]